MEEKVLMRIHDDENDCDLVSVKNPLGHFGMSIFAEKNGERKPVDGMHMLAKMIEQVGNAGYDEISDGNITEVDGKKYLTPLGAGTFRNSLNVEFTITATEDGGVTWVEEPIVRAELIVGETYRVTVNGVTDDYVCYVGEYGAKIIGTDEGDMTVEDWVIYEGKGCLFVAVYGNVGEVFNFSIHGTVVTTKPIDQTLGRPFLYTPFELYIDPSFGDGLLYWLDNPEKLVTSSEFNEIISKSAIGISTDNGVKIISGDTRSFRDSKINTSYVPSENRTQIRITTYKVSFVVPEEPNEAVTVSVTTECQVYID